jgi:pantoate--beta-alanine ligase
VITTTLGAELRKVCDTERANGAQVGFVPTMGALHDGHRSLIRRARAETTFVVVSIFVNPTQFGPREDLTAYPRSLDADLAACEAEGVDVVFHPDADEVYGANPKTTVHVAELTETMEGAHRPGHFDGVALVCTKLFNITGECAAYFGRKDAQQLRVIQQLVKDLDLPVDIAQCETIRDADGLALSSRNAYLSAEERARALALPRALRAIAAGASLEDGRAMLSGVEVDYLEMVDPDTLEPVSERPALVCGAIRVGRTRLIDNVTIE